MSLALRKQCRGRVWTEIVHQPVRTRPLKSSLRSITALAPLLKVDVAVMYLTMVAMTQRIQGLRPP